MGFNSVYQSLKEIFPQIDARLLRAVAIEHPKDADEAAAIVLSEIIPSLPSNLSNNQHLIASTLNSNIASSSSSETTMPRVDNGVCHENVQSEELQSLKKARGKGHEIFDVDHGLCVENVQTEELQSLKKAHGKEHEFIDRSIDVPSESKTGFHVSVTTEDDDDLASSFDSTVSQDYPSGFLKGDDFRLIWNQKLVDPIPLEHTDNTNQAEATTNLVDENSECSLAGENGETESTHGSKNSVDHLEEIIEDAKSNKKTLLTVMESVMNLMKEVELEEKYVEESEEEVAKGGLETLEKVEDLKKMLKHAKEANEMHAGEVYGEKSVLATEVKELQNRLLNLSEERNKSLATLDEMRETLEIRLAAALEVKNAFEKEKKEKEDSALKALAEQEAIMEKIVEESKLLKQEAEDNSKLREFLMDRGQIVDSLQGEISVICQDVKLLKEKLDNRVSLTRSFSSPSQTSSSKQSLVLESPNGSLVLESPNGSLVLESLEGSLVLESPNGSLVLESLEGSTTSSMNRESPEASVSSMDKGKDYRAELIEDGWDIFEKDIEF